MKAGSLIFSVNVDDSKAAKKLDELNRKIGNVKKRSRRKRQREMELLKALKPQRKRQRPHGRRSSGSMQPCRRARAKRSLRRGKR